VTLLNVDDIVRGVVAAVDNIGPSVKPVPLRVYNLGNKNPETVSTLVDLLEEFLGKKALRQHVEMPPTGDVLRTSADASLAKAELGYEPTTSLRDGIRKFVEWYKAYYPDGLDEEIQSYVPM